MVDVGAGERQVAHHPVHPGRAAQLVADGFLGHPAQPGQQGPVHQNQAKDQRPGRRGPHGAEHRSPGHRMTRLEHGQPHHQQAVARQQRRPEPAVRPPRLAAPGPQLTVQPRRPPLDPTGQPQPQQAVAPPVPHPLHLCGIGPATRRL